MLILLHILSSQLVAGKQMARNLVAEASLRRIGTIQMLELERWRKRRLNPTKWTQAPSLDSQLELHSARTMLLTSVQSNQAPWLHWIDKPRREVTAQPSAQRQRRFKQPVFRRRIDLGKIVQSRRRSENQRRRREDWEKREWIRWGLILIIQWTILMIQLSNLTANNIMAVNNCKMLSNSKTSCLKMILNFVSIWTQNFSKRHSMPTWWRKVWSLSWRKWWAMDRLKITFSSKQGQHFKIPWHCSLSLKILLLTTT